MWQSIENDRERYAAYLCSREWAVLKEAVKRRSGGICERCCFNKSDAVHHLTYARKYKEQLSDLLDICNGCHNFTHGKSNVDPALSAPPILCGTTIRSVYLAGRFGDGWRESLSDQRTWVFPSGDGPTMSRVGDIPVPGRTVTVSCVGPSYVRFNEHSKIGIGSHECGQPGSKSHDNWTVPRYETVRNRIQEIFGTDLIFAWMKDDQCYGTIAEIGFARGTRYSLRSKKPVVAVAISPTFNEELWFCQSMADIVVSGSSARECWEKLWAGDHKTLYDIDVGAAWEVEDCGGHV